MLGELILDPEGVEGGGQADGLGLLPVRTEFGTQKRTVLVEGSFDEANVTLLIDDAKLAAKTCLDRRPDGIDVKIANGSAVIFR